MADLATLRISVDSREVKKAQDDLRALGYTATQTEGATNRMAGAFGALKNMLGGLALAFAVREFVQMADSVALLEARLKSVTPAGQELANAQKQLVSISKENMVALEATASLYTKLAKPIRALGGDTQTTLNITSAFTKALKIGGASAQEASAAIMQFGQAMASGVLRGDEFNSIAEASPRILQAIAEGSGIAAGQLRAMAADGKLTAGVIGGALLKQMVALEAEAMRIPQTVDGAFTNFKTDLALVASDLNKNVGLTSALISVFGALSSTVSTLGNVAATSITAFTQFLRDNRDAVMMATYAVGAFAGALLGLAVAARIGAAIVALTATINGLMAATAAARIGFVAMAATMGTLPAIFAAVRTAAIALYASLGPVGWAMAAIGAAAGFMATRYLAAQAAMQAGAKRNADFTKELAALQARINATNTGDPAKIRAVDNAQQLADYAAALKERGFTEQQVNQLVSARGKLQQAELRQAQKLEAASASQAAAASARSKAEAAAAKARAEAEAKARKARETYENFQNNIADLEQQIALIKEGASIEDARMRVQLARQGASAAQISQILTLTKELNAEEKRASEERAQVENRKNADETLAQLRDEMFLLQKGLSIEEARLRVQLARPGVTVEQINAIIAETNALDAQKKAIDDAKKAAEDARKAFDALTINIDLDGVFGNAGKAAANLINVFEKMADAQAKYNDLQKNTKRTEAQIATDRAKYARLQISSYADILSSAKGFFKEGSSGYKVLQAAETAYRAVSIALALKEMAVKIAGYGASAAAATAGAGAEVAAATAVGQANAAAAVANQGKGDPFTAWARIAAMAALMAGLGFAVLGGGSSKPPTTNTGTGTVFGDTEAQSKSITSSIERLVDINGNTMRYSSQMLSSLKNIEAAMVGVTNIVLRSTGITDLSNTVKTGNSANFGQKVGGTAAMAGAGAGLGFAVAGPVGAIVGAGLGAAMSLIKGLVSSLFGTKTSVVGQGITATAQSVSDIIATGFDALYYTEIEKKKKFFGITTSTSYQTQTAAADAEINRQFSLVIQNIYDAVLATAGPLKLATDQVAKNVESFVVDIGKIDIKGLTGEQIQEKLTAVFGAAADNIAKAAVPGLEEFQRVGEGYFETLVRVASNIEVLNRAFQMLGQTTQNLTIQSQMALIETFGDATDMMEQVSEYFSNFYSETEQVAIISKQLGEALGLMGLQLPDTLAGFRALVEAQDLNTEAGRKAYVQLIQLSPAFADLISRMEDLGMTEAVVTDRSEILRQARQMEITLMELQGDTAGALAARRQDELAAMDESLRSIQRAIYAFEDLAAANEKVKSAQANLATAIQNRDRAEREAQVKAKQAQIESIRAEINGLNQVIAGRETAKQALRAAYDAEVQRIDGEIANRQRNIQSLETAYQSQASIIEETIDKFRSFANSLREFAATIIPLNSTGPGSIETLRKRFADLMQQALGGNDAAMSEVTTVGGQLRESIISSATDRVSMLRNLYALQNQTNEFAQQAEQQATIGEQQLAVLQSQYNAMIAAEQQAIAKLEADKIALATQVEQFITLGDKVLTVDEAIRQLQTAEAAALVAETQKALLEQQIVNLEAQIVELQAVTNQVMSVEQAQRDLAAAQAERDAILADIDRNGFFNVVDQLRSTEAAIVSAVAAGAAQTAAAAATATATANAAAATATAAASAVKSIATPNYSNVISFPTVTSPDTFGGWGGRFMDNLNIQQYANGGLHSGGLRIVGENGPELEATGASRIYNANQLSDMMGGGATAEEVKALRDELKLAMYQIAKNTGKSYDLMNRWDGDGLPETRDVAA